MSEPSFVEHTSCDMCGSSDANALYSDGHTYCFSCGHTTRGAHSPDGASKARPVGLISGEIKALRKRGITEETCQKWKYMVGDYHGRPVQIAPYCDKDGILIAQKIRFPDKDFMFLGNPKKAGLFGMHLWKDGGKKVVVTEGEIDALTVSQLQGNKWPVVSVPNGAQGAAKSITGNIEWLEQFDEVILMFDMDEPGQAAALECADLLTPGKAKIASLPLKDANEMLLADRGPEVIAAIWGARTYRPEGLLIGDLLKDLMDKPVEEGISYPWDELTAPTYGIRLHEIITILSGSGMGKTEIFKEIAYHLAITHNQKVGLFFLEEQPQHTLRCMVSKHLNKRIYLPGALYSEQEVDDAIISLQDKLVIFDHRGVSDFEIIIQKVRYLVHIGVQYIFLDHITAMAEGKGEDNINARIHYIMDEINKITQNLPVTVFLISHIRKTADGKSVEEGGRVTLDMAYGSGAIKQRSNFVFALERNQQATDKDERNASCLRILKDRLTGGGIGTIVPLKYNQDTGRLLDNSRESPFDLAPLNEDF